MRTEHQKHSHLREGRHWLEVEPTTSLVMSTYDHKERLWNNQIQTHAFSILLIFSRKAAAHNIMSFITLRYVYLTPKYINNINLKINS